MPGKSYTTEEVELLKGLWESGAPQEEIQRHFPNRNWKSIQCRMQRAGVSRGFAEEEYGESTLDPMYVVGFTDGEGYFTVQTNVGGHGGIGQAFGIKLRADDLPILEEIRNFFKCGRIYRGTDSDTSKHKHDRRNAKPQYTFTVFRKEDIDNVIIPFFEQYPLRAKKRRDFEIWKQVSELRKQLERGKDKPELKREIDELILELRMTRQYTEPLR